MDVWNRIPIRYQHRIRCVIYSHSCHSLLVYLGIMWRRDDYGLLDGRIMPRSSMCWYLAFAIFILSGFRRRGNMMYDIMFYFTFITNWSNQIWEFLKNVRVSWITNWHVRSNSRCVAASVASYNRCVCNIVNQTVVLYIHRKTKM